MCHQPQRVPGVFDQPHGFRQGLKLSQVEDGAAPGQGLRKQLQTLGIQRNGQKTDPRHSPARAPELRRMAPGDQVAQ